MQAGAQATDIARVIQLSVAPVFLISGVGALLAVMSSRLARLVDRARVLEAAISAADEGGQARIREELQVLSRRSKLIYRAITLGTDLRAADLLRHRIALHQRARALSDQQGRRRAVHRRDAGPDLGAALFPARSISGDARVTNWRMKYPREKIFFVCTGPRCSNPDRGEERGEVIRED